MLGKTHLTIGCAVTLPLVLNGDIHAFFGAISLIGAVAPDFDKGMGLKHRGFSHSLLATAITTLAIGYFSDNLAFAWSVNYLGHIIADSFTTRGVPLLWPWKKYVGLKLFDVNPITDKIVNTLTIVVIIIELVFLTNLKNIFL